MRRNALKISWVHIYILCSVNDEIELNRLGVRLWPKKTLMLTQQFKEAWEPISNNLASTGLPSGRLSVIWELKPTLMASF